MVRVCALWMVLWLISPPAVHAQQRQVPQPEIVGGRVLPGYAPLLKELRAGGLVLLFRHERTALNSRWDRATTPDPSCRRQRNLSSVGRASSRALGTALRSLMVPIGPVVSSPYCRAKDTVRLAFGRIDGTTPRLFGPDGKARDLEAVRREVTLIIAERARPGVNLVLVGHHGTVLPFTEAFLDEGDALILKPRGSASPEIVADMPAARWDELVREEQRRAAGF